MWLLRLLGILLVVAIGAGFLLYVITGNRNYLTFVFRLLRWSVVFALIVFALMIIERVAIIPV
jgi:hypothetical protein